MTGGIFQGNFLGISGKSDIPIHTLFIQYILYDRSPYFVYYDTVPDPPLPFIRRCSVGVVDTISGGGGEKIHRYKKKKKKLDMRTNTHVWPAPALPPHNRRCRNRRNATQRNGWRLANKQMLHEVASRGERPAQSFCELGSVDGVDTARCSTINAAVGAVVISIVGFRGFVYIVSSWYCTVLYYNIDGILFTLRHPYSSTAV